MIKVCIFDKSNNVSRFDVFQVMNEKLNQCVGLVELLRDHLKDKHHTRLELMIIILIMIEVCNHPSIYHVSSYFV